MSGREIECFALPEIRRWPTARNIAAPIPDPTDVQTSAASPVAHPIARAAADPTVRSIEVPIGTLPRLRPVTAIPPAPAEEIVLVAPVGTPLPEGLLTASGAAVTEALPPAPRRSPLAGAGAGSLRSVLAGAAVIAPRARGPGEVWAWGPPCADGRPELPGGLLQRLPRLPASGLRSPRSSSGRMAFSSTEGAACSG